MEPMEDGEMLVKCRLDAPVDGLYKIYGSFYGSPAGAAVRFFQRQNNLSEWWDLNRPDQEYLEMKEIGAITVSEGYATVSFHVRGGQGSRFILHNLQIERINQE